jgi:hypothetical protein
MNKLSLSLGHRRLSWTSFLPLKQEVKETKAFFTNLTSHIGKKKAKLLKSEPS